MISSIVFYIGIYMLLGLLACSIVCFCEEDLEDYMFGIMLTFPIVIVYVAIKQIVGLYRKITKKEKTYTEHIHVTVEEKNTALQKQTNSFSYEEIEVNDN